MVPKIWGRKLIYSLGLYITIIKHRTDSALIFCAPINPLSMVNIVQTIMSRRRYANERQANGSKINLLYSTPSCYLKSLHDAGISWPTKSDDFFPYASDPHAYWTGYFTSRPTLKRFERDGNHFLQVCKQLSALAPQQSAEFDPHLNFMRETMGIMQHHDAVTGTEKEKVALDYAKRLSVAFRACSTNIRSVLNQLSKGSSQETSTNYPLELKTCSLLNITSCSTSESSSRFALTLYNPLAHRTNEFVRIPVLDYNYVVTDSSGKSLPTQVVPIPAPVLSIKQRNSSATYELVFLASNLPAVGFKTYFIEKSDDTAHKKPKSLPKKSTSYTVIGDKNFNLTFDTNGFLSQASADGMTRMISQEFLYYEGEIGNNKEYLNRSSGAYIFRPKEGKLHFATDHVSIDVYKGSLVHEVHQKFNDWISQVVRIYNGRNYAEFEWLVGPIPIEDGNGKEIITRFNSDIKSEGIFYTDSNGREMIKRQRDHRDTWNLKLHESVSGNYYPVTTKIALEDSTARMAILTDRAQGGSSMQDGALELMVHRRLLHDDAFGVGEALNETEYGIGLIARGKNHLFIGASLMREDISLKAMERLVQLETLLPSWKFFSNMKEYTQQQWLSEFTNSYTGISSTLPKSAHLLTLEPWHDNELLVRFEHILEKDEDSNYSKYVQFNVKDVLGGFKIVDMRETTLDGNAWLDEHRRFEFVPDPEDESYNAYGVFKKQSNRVHLLDAAKPLLGVKYSNEALETGELGAESNRIRRSANNRHFTMHRERTTQDERKSANKAYVPANDRAKYLIELSPMEIRTFVIYLE
ncbi:lysosomal alpha-mannosidase isoform X3 [Drosophila sulfurigaster albostrigata]|uniref:lysosomal alpha-mannosidase isoform X3 n=1 Tax=Drosophila sulfurigaster albostrigata TaxID=89887 RepID=UPI002D21CD17|nr:lysosomal alpha-mannosidase isoform X3 [Drosophila sulfurigaster albostrigata]